MTRRNLGYPPGTGLAALDDWTRGISQTLIEMPTFSVTSTTGGPEGNLIGSTGHINVDIGSCVTKLWIKHTQSVTSTGWYGYSALNAPDPTLLSDIQTNVFAYTPSADSSYLLPSAASSVNSLFVIKKMSSTYALGVRTSYRSVEADSCMTLSTQYDSATFASDGTDWWII